MYNIDLTHEFNHKIFEFRRKKLFRKYFCGVNDFYLVNDLTNDDTRYKRGSHLKYDNLYCDGQTLCVDRKMKCMGIEIIGFSEFGTISENVNIYTYCNKMIECEFVMKSIQTNNFQGIDDNKKNKKCCVLRKFWGSDKQKHSIYSWKIKLNDSIEIEKIILPVNNAIHILSIELLIEKNTAHST